MSDLLGPVETAAGVNENVTKSDAALAVVASDLWKLKDFRL